ncbi:MAG: excinuclease ABC subunit UvrC [Oscillospiraceae bacterium]|jgi:excinuclease ABC subunit C|nr:excinuclease ABC subunit UvrC [Oscillospiraceae bacterium]
MIHNPRLQYLHEKTLKLTQESGCYLMKDSGGAIIYVGKAKNLKNRVSSYFRYSGVHEAKTAKMVESVFDYDYIVTGSEFEALVLECGLIKLHMPKYNILLKDDKGYHYIKISAEKYPRITAAPHKAEDGARYIGPYTSSFAVTQAVEEANKAFLLPICTRRFPDDFGKQRPCLNFYIKQCMGLCRGSVSREEYAQTLADSISFLTEKSADTIKNLEKQMLAASENLEFEKAARLRDRIHAIQKINEKQKVMFTFAEDQDVIALAMRKNDACALILKFRNGRLVDKVHYELGEIDNLEEAREEFIQLYYSNSSHEIPGAISLDGEIPNFDLITELLSERLGRKVRLFVPIKGEAKRLSEMASQNAAEMLSFDKDISAKELSALDELARLLGLKSTPVYIEAYDISNLGASDMVAGMVVFENGRPNKKFYRRFSIKTLEGQNDYGAMAEVVTRRLNHYREEKETGEGFGRLPDLILLDGGKGHVSTVRPIVSRFGLDIPVFGMVKDGRHKTRAIAENGGEIAIKPSRAVFGLVYRIQEEVHRFSVEYQRRRHGRSAFESSLTKIEGIGAARAKNLMKKFKTVRAIGEAGLDSLRETPGMTRASAEKLYAYFHHSD